LCANPRFADGGEPTQNLEQVRSGT
jgi:hypothetical protein